MSSASRCSTGKPARVTNHDQTTSFAADVFTAKPGGGRLCCGAAPDSRRRAGRSRPARRQRSHRRGLYRCGTPRPAVDGPSKQGRIVAVSDIYRKRADEIAAKLKCRGYYEYRKMLEARDVNAVIIATPDHWRALPSIHACQARKHVYTEKPLSLTIRKGRAMVAAARKYRCAFQTGGPAPFDQQTRTGCQLVRADVIGKVHTVVAANYPSPWKCGLPGQPVLDGLDWDVCAARPSRVPITLTSSRRGLNRVGSRSRPTPAARQPVGERTGWTRSNGRWAPTPRARSIFGPKPTSRSSRRRTGSRKRSPVATGCAAGASRQLPLPERRGGQARQWSARRRRVSRRPWHGMDRQQ